MTAQPGTYALIFKCRARASARVGRWGRLDLVRSYYVYVGSAFGPGGLRARVSRHCRRDKPKHWHIDYLREFLEPVAVWYSHESIRLEHRWAKIFSLMDETTSTARFGCSDCRCGSHLFTTGRLPDYQLFRRIAGGEIASRSLKSPRAISLAGIISTC